MRVLYHHRTLGDGAEGVHVSAMVEALRALGHTVDVAAMIGDRTQVSTARTRFFGTLARRLPRPAYELGELAYGAVGYRMLGAYLSKARPDFLYERHTLFNFAGLAAARRARIPFVLEVNSPLAYERSRYEQLSLARVARATERAVCVRADLVVTVSTPLRDHLASMGVEPERVLVLPNGADPDLFKPDRDARDEIRSRFGIPKDAVVVCFVGILRPWHGVDLLMRALSQVRTTDGPIRALVVGDGPSQNDLLAVAKAAGIGERVTFTGRVAHAEIPRHVAACDIGVSPRATFYASPMKVPEYMACGLATVGPRMRNLADLVDHERTGLLFEPEDAAALAAALQRLMDRPDERLRFGQAARTEILASRTWKHHAARVIQRVAEVLDR